MINQNFLTPQCAALLAGVARDDRPVRPLPLPITTPLITAVFILKSISTQIVQVLNESVHF